MIVVPPVEITPEKLVSNVPESDNPAWSPSADYHSGDKVIRDHRNYEALSDNTNKDPISDSISSPVWVDLGATNRWAMFNKRKGNKWSIGTFTANPESIDVTITPGQRVNSIGLVGVSAASVQIQMIVDGDVVYDFTQPMSRKAGGSWYRYYFGEFQTANNVARFDLPAFNNSQIRVVASSPGGIAKIGMLVIGMSRELGWARWGTGIGFDSYSSVKENDFGDITITPRGKRDYVEYDVAMFTGRVSTAKRVLEGLQDTAALYIGSDSVDSTVIIGRFDRFQLVLSNVSISEYSLSVRSLN